MALEWEQTIVEARDPAALGRWWAQALGWVVVDDSPEEYEIRPAADRMPGLLFVRAAEPKRANPLHLDFRPDDQAAEVARLLEHGARRADIGQGEDATWVVLADPEDNEFCVLSSHPHQRSALSSPSGP
ncbi:VOC family protein [Streptomyces roseus]|uniref:VOC family protein n=1 Tax=Streptomyces roseus TaxID=66430 RepID=UPI003684E41B